MVGDQQQDGADGREDRAEALWGRFVKAGRIEAHLLDPHGPLGADFKEATERVVAGLGPSAKRTRGATSRWETVTLDSGPSRVRVVKLGADRVAVVRADNALSKAVLDARVRNAPRAEPELDEDTQAALR